MKTHTKNSILNLAKDAFEVKSDNQLAMRLGISRSLLSAHRHDPTIMFGAVLLYRLAKITGIPPEDISAIILKEKVKMSKGKTLYIMSNWLRSESLC